MIWNAWLSWTIMSCTKHYDTVVNAQKLMFWTMKQIANVISTCAIYPWISNKTISCNFTKKTFSCFNGGLNGWQQLIVSKSISPTTKSKRNSNSIVCEINFVGKWDVHNSLSNEKEKKRSLMN